MTQPLALITAHEGFDGTEYVGHTDSACDFAQDGVKTTEAPAGTDVVACRFCAGDVYGGWKLVGKEVARDDTEEPQAREYGDGSGQGGGSHDGPSEKQVAFFLRLMGEKVLPAKFPTDTPKSKRAMSTRIDKLMALPSKQTETNGPSEKQAEYWRSLATAAGVDAEAVEAEFVKQGLWTKQNVSKMIDAYRNAPKAPLPPKAKGQHTAEGTLEGFHMIEGVIYKCQRNLAGTRTYAKRLILPTGEYAGDKGTWDYDAGAMRKLSEETRMTKEAAAEFGHLYGFCGCCGARLTDERSIEAGIGPVCAKKNF